MRNTIGNRHPLEIKVGDNISLRRNATIRSSAVHRIIVIGKNIVKNNCSFFAHKIPPDSSSRFVTRDPVCTIIFRISLKSNSSFSKHIVASELWYGLSVSHAGCMDLSSDTHSFLNAQAQQVCANISPAVRYFQHHSASALITNHQCFIFRL